MTLDDQDWFKAIMVAICLGLLVWRFWPESKESEPLRPGRTKVGPIDLRENEPGWPGAAKGPMPPVGHEWQQVFSDLRLPEDMSPPRLDAIVAGRRYRTVWIVDGDIWLTTGTDSPRPGGQLLWKRENRR